MVGGIRQNRRRWRMKVLVTLIHTAADGFSLCSSDVINLLLWESGSGNEAMYPLTIMRWAMCIHNGRYL